MNFEDRESITEVRRADTELHGACFNVEGWANTLVEQSLIWNRGFSPASLNKTTGLKSRFRQLFQCFGEPAKASPAAV